MAILGQNLDYTDKDFDALRVRAYALIESVFPRWTSQQVADFGNILIELFLFVGDVLTKYQDNQARESRWAFATQRKNLIALAKLIQYEPFSATASQVDVTISLLDGSNALADITIPAGSIVRTRSVSDRVVFRTLADATILAGANSIAGVTAENSESADDSFAASAVANQEIVLTATPYIDGSVSVTAGNGAYTEVDNFLDSTSTDLHFTLTVDQNDQATIRFGDGVAGAVPTGTILVDYSIGGGAAGIVEQGTVTAIDGVYQDDLATVVQLAVTNPAASTPAVDRETVEQIRQSAPLSLRVLNRSVAREDFEINALRLASVARALMLTSDQNPAVGENAGILYVIPVGGGLPTQALKDAVLEQVTVTYPSTLTFQVSVLDPAFATVDVKATVFLRSGVAPATADATIRANLAAFFASENADGTLNENIGFGYDYVESTGETTGKLPFSDVYNVVRDSSGVRKMGANVGDFTLNDAHSDVELELSEFPVLGTVTLINGETGSALV